jgi:hypothetical protein
VRVFLASPGDVPDERAFVRDYLESGPQTDPLLERRARFDVVSWDHPHAPTPMPEHLTPTPSPLSVGHETLATTHLVANAPLGMRRK